MKRIVTGLSFLIAVLGSNVARAVVDVVTTIPDLGAIATEVGGANVVVTALVKPTQDPHFVDAKPSSMVKLNEADLLLETGVGLESGWLPALVTGSRNADIQPGGKGRLDCSTLVVLKDVRTADRSQGDIHPGGNPHYWYDPRNGLRLAQGIARRLSELDPDHAAGYAAGYGALESRLKGKIALWKARLEPRRGTKVVVYHESWIYFLDWAGYQQVGALEPKPGIPANAGHVAELLLRVKDQGVKYVLQESYYPTQLSRLFADKSGATLKVLPTMVGASGTRTYADVVDRQVDELTR